MDSTSRHVGDAAVMSMIPVRAWAGSSPPERMIFPIPYMAPDPLFQVTLLAQSVSGPRSLHDPEPVTSSYKNVVALLGAAS